MKTAEHPEQYSPDLTEERLRIVSENLLDVLDEAEGFARSPNATAWFKGTANYGLPQGMLRRMHSDDSYPWLTLANQTMDYTAQIGKTLIQFVVDDPNSPRKTHRLKRNSVERSQLVLDLEQHCTDFPLTWRFYLTPKSNGVDYSPSISLVGFDINEEPVCTWEYGDVISGPVTTETPEPVEIDEPVLVRKTEHNRKQENE